MDRQGRFQKLVQCFETNARLTRPCATLWAHFGAMNGVKCTDFCIPNAQFEILLNNPDCTLSNCIACSANDFEADFNALAGLWKSPYNAGFVDEIAYPCDVFYRVDTFDPCVGALTEEVPDIDPTFAPTSFGLQLAASPLLNCLQLVTVLAMAWMNTR